MPWKLHLQDSRRRSSIGGRRNINDAVRTGAARTRRSSGGGRVAWTILCRDRFQSSARNQFSPMTWRNLKSNSSSSWNVLTDYAQSHFNMKLNVQLGWFFPNNIFILYRIYIYIEMRYRCLYIHGLLEGWFNTDAHQCPPSLEAVPPSRRKSIACIASSKTATGEDKAARIGEIWGVRL